MDELNDIKKNSVDYLSNSLAVFKENENHINSIVKISELCIRSIEDNNKIIFCGNGGSASDSNHLAAEIVGRFLKDKKPLPAISLSSNNSIITALANDYGYEYIFSKQIESIANKGDILFLISTSGKSKNILNAANVGKEKGLKVVSFTGKNNTELHNFSDENIKINSDISGIIQQCHITLGQLICYNIENYFLNK